MGIEKPSPWAISSSWHAYIDEEDWMLSSSLGQAPLPGKVYGMLRYMCDYLTHEGIPFSFSAGKEEVVWKYKGWRCKTLPVGQQSRFGPIYECRKKDACFQEKFARQFKKKIDSFGEDPKFLYPTLRRFLAQHGLTPLDPVRGKRVRVQTSREEALALVESIKRNTVNLLPDLVAEWSENLLDNTGILRLNGVCDGDFIPSIYNLELLDADDTLLPGTPRKDR